MQRTKIRLDQGQGQKCGYRESCNISNAASNPVYLLAGLVCLIYENFHVEHDTAPTTLRARTEQPDNLQWRVLFHTMDLTCGPKFRNVDAVIGLVCQRVWARTAPAWSRDLLSTEDKSHEHLICDDGNRRDEGWYLLCVTRRRCTRLCLLRQRRTSDPEKWSESKELPSGREVEDRCLVFEGAINLFNARMQVPGPDHWKVRSRSFDGIAVAIGTQWGKEAVRAAV